MRIPIATVCLFVVFFVADLAQAQQVPAFGSAPAPDSVVFNALASITSPRSVTLVPVSNPQHTGSSRAREGSPDITLARIQERKASAGRVALGATLGLAAGAAVGFIHGAAGHPGLPHIGLDVPSELEYTPLFALGGAIVGGIIGAKPPRN